MEGIAARAGSGAPARGPWGSAVPPRAGGFAPAFVWTAWGAMLLVVLVCIVRYGRNIPLAEDWTLVPAYTGREHDLLGWLWAQNNEHRLPIPKLLLLGLLWLTGGDFRAGMTVSALLLAGMAAMLMATASALRGGPRWTDILFPLLLLNLGNWENLVWSWQLQFTFSAALTLLLLVAVLRAMVSPNPLWPGLAAAALVLLPLSGANGLIVALALAPWALYAAFTAPPDAPRMRLGPLQVPVRALWLGGAALAGAALVGLYFVGYRRPPWNPPSPGLVETLRTTARIGAMGLTPAAVANWKLFIVLTVGFLGAATFFLVRGGTTAWLSGDVRRRGAVVGLVCFAFAAAGVTLALGFGRAGLVPTVGLPTRYALLALPSLCLAYFVWELYAPTGWRRGLQAALCAVVLLTLPADILSGFSWRDWYVGGMRSVEGDLAAGVPRAEIARRRRQFLLHWDERLLAEGIADLRDTRRGPFRKVREGVGPGTRPTGTTVTPVRLSKVKPDRS